ncbi:sigma-70 family RNA polymerase sigma factor [Nocardioides sp. LMS-CY]|nr:sigma-70 family RNA polymerase sigma factor [Nocardioides sp. LMS-CY]
MSEHDESAPADGAGEDDRPVRPVRGGAGVPGPDEGSGVKQPFERVVEVYGATVLRVCRAVLGRHDAEDAWSETFLAAMRAYPDLPPDANIEAWLVTIAHRKAIDIVRAINRRPLPVEEPPERPAAPDSDLDASELWQSVRALPDKQRQAVAYHYVAGLPYAEIARILGGTTDAARRAAADGIKKLRQNYPGPSTEGAPS